MVLEIFLNTIANIAITTVVSYLFIQFIPKQRPYSLPWWKKISIILVSCLTVFVLMSFSLELREQVKIDLRFNVLILLLYYFGSGIYIPTLLLTGLIRLSWGFSDAAIYTFVVYIVLGILLPIINKKLSQNLNNYGTGLLLNTVYIVCHSLSLAIIYQNFQEALPIAFFNFMITSICLVLDMAFIEDMRKNVERYINEKNRAKIDYLTGLHNKREFSRQWSEIENNQEILETAFLMLDIDHFKGINDQHGHMNGDTVLHQLAKLLHIQGIEQQHIYRVGGEEFCIILTNFSCAEQKKIAEEIRTTVEQHPFVLENRHTIYLTVSIGLASSNKEKDMKNLYRLADQALYTAKENGRNQVVALDFEE